MEYEPLILGYTSGEVGMPDTDNQIKILKQAGCHRIIIGENRFLGCIEALNEGDTLIACGLKSIPCGLDEFVSYMNDFESRGVGFCTLKEGDFIDADLSNPDTAPQIQLFSPK